MAAGDANQRSSRCVRSEQFASRSRKLAEGSKHFRQRDGGGQEQVVRFRSRSAEASLEVVRRQSAARDFFRQRRGGRRQNVRSICQLEGNVSRRSVGQESDRQKARRVSRS